jgi:hypothetical protein
LQAAQRRHRPQQAEATDAERETIRTLDREALGATPPALKVSSLTRTIHSGGSASPMSTFTRQSIALVIARLSVRGMLDKNI